MQAIICHDQKVMKLLSSKNRSKVVCEKGTFSQIRSHMVFGMLWNAGLVLRMCAYKWIIAMKRLTPGSGSEDCCKNSVRYMKNNCKCKSAF